LADGCEFGGRILLRWDPGAAIAVWDVAADPFAEGFAAGAGGLLAHVSISFPWCVAGLAGVEVLAGRGRVDAGRLELGVGQLR
jgi:hypothetical protein